MPDPRYWKWVKWLDTELALLLGGKDDTNGLQGAEVSQDPEDETLVGGGPHAGASCAQKSHCLLVRLERGQAGEKEPEAVSSTADNESTEGTCESRED